MVTPEIMHCTLSILHDFFRLLLFFCYFGSKVSLESCRSQLLPENQAGSRKIDTRLYPSALNSGRISESEAPILLILRNPRMPKVDGKTHENPCQKPGILLNGHETPVIKSNGTEVNTTEASHFHDILPDTTTSDRRKRTKECKEGGNREWWSTLPYLQN